MGKDNTKFSGIVKGGLRVSGQELFPNGFTFNGKYDEKEKKLSGIGP